MNRLSIIALAFAAALTSAAPSAAGTKKHHHPSAKNPQKHLTVAQRENIYYEDGTAENAAEKRADRECPAVDQPSTLLNGKLIVRYEDECHTKLEKKYHLTYDQFSAIMGEGMDKGWPTPA